MKISELLPSEQAKVRSYNRDAKRRQRERELLERVSKIDLYQKEVIRSERRKRNLVCFGEIEFGRNAQTSAEEIFVHRLFLRELKQPDVQHGETLKALSKRCYDHWTTKYGNDREYAPAFSLTTLTFDHDFGFEVSKRPFEEIWTAPRGGGDTPIDVANLPPLPPLSETKTPAPVVAPNRVAPMDDDAKCEREVLQQKQSYHGLPTEAVQYLAGDKR